MPDMSCALGSLDFACVRHLPTFWRAEAGRGELCQKAPHSGTMLCQFCRMAQFAALAAAFFFIRMFSVSTKTEKAIAK